MNKESFNIATTSFIELCDEYGDFTANIIQLLKEMEKSNLISINNPQEVVGAIANHLSTTKSVHFKSYLTGGQSMYEILKEKND